MCAIFENINWGITKETQHKEVCIQFQHKSSISVLHLTEPKVIFLCKAMRLPAFPVWERVPSTRSPKPEPSSYFCLPLLFSLCVHQILLFYFPNELTSFPCIPSLALPLVQTLLSPLDEYKVSDWIFCFPHSALLSRVTSLKTV